MWAAARWVADCKHGGGRITLLQPNRSQSFQIAEQDRFTDWIRGILSESGTETEQRYRQSMKKRSRWLIVALISLSMTAVRAGDPPFSPKNSAERMTVPEGFKVSLFAGEPDVVQPIAFAIDSRGRLWVAECLSYPKWAPEGRDRIVILEDEDGDGQLDSRKVFWDRGNYLTGLELGFGGVWVTSAPNLMFIPDRDGDDVPDGEPEIHLDGWAHQGVHNVVNGLTWGPDGWLYGGHGILSKSKIGKPGTPESERERFNCGVWRYHPTQRVFEVVAWGTTNPWGLDFNDYGDLFITNCVIPHAFHVVPGAHFERMFGNDFNPHLYGLMESCADHIHWAGGAWQSSRGGAGKHGEAGGGHAHCGAMVYLGDNWPDRYRGSLFVNNLHGNRINHDRLERRGSGYVARHEPDFLSANDRWFWGVELKYGPDGAVYATDWTNDGECHGHDSHRNSGRIYKISFGDVRSPTIDLAAMSDRDLAGLQLHRNDWFVRQSRLLLQGRCVQRRLQEDARTFLEKTLRDHPDVTRRLRALWTLYVCGEFDDNKLRALLGLEEPDMRRWGVRLALDDREVGPETLRELIRSAKTDPSAAVRLELAAGLQRLSLQDRTDLALALAARHEDAADPNFPLMLWYGLEPMVAQDSGSAERLLRTARLPLIRNYVARRWAAAALESDWSRLGSLLNLLNEEVVDETGGAEILSGILSALEGRKDLRPAPAWESIAPKLWKSNDSVVRHKARVLSLLFGSRPAVLALLAVVEDADADLIQRRESLRALVQRRVADILPVLLRAMSVRGLRLDAIRGLAQFDSEEIPEELLRRYPSLSLDEKRAAVATLAARVSFAAALLDAIAAEIVPVRDLSPLLAEQIHGFDDATLRKKLSDVWGQLADSKRADGLEKRIRELLSPKFLRTGDSQRGRVLFDQRCGSCHRFFDDGTALGPDLTGSDRKNVGYLIENILYPSRVVGREHRLTTVVTKDGRVLSGMVLTETAATLTIRTTTDEIIVTKEDISKRRSSRESFMPDGLLGGLDDEEIRDLFNYLGSPVQVRRSKDD